MRRADCALLHDEFGLQCAGRLHRLQDGDDAGRLEADGIEAAHQGAQGRALQYGYLSARLIGLDLRARDDDRLSLRQRRRLRDLRRLGDARL